MNNSYWQTGQPQAPFTPQPPLNGKAIASLVLGILSIVLPFLGFIVGIVAIAIAALALREIRRRSDGGKGLAIAGLTCGVIGTCFYILLIAMMIFGLLFEGTTTTHTETFVTV